MQIYNLQNGTAPEATHTRVSKARNTAQCSDWSNHLRERGALKWMEGWRIREEGWGRFQGERGCGLLRKPNLGTQ